MRVPIRKLWPLFAAGTLPVLTTAILAPALPGLHQEFLGSGDREMLSRMVMTTPALAIALSAPILGEVADRWGRSRVLHASLLVFSLLGLFGVVAPDIYSLIVSRFIFGLAVAGIMTSTAAWLADASPPGSLRSRMALQAGILGGFGIVSQILAGFLAEQGWRWPFVLYALALPLLWLAHRQWPTPALGKSEDRLTPQAFAPSSHVGLFVGFFSFVAMGLFIVIPIQAPFYFGHQLGLGPQATAYFVSALTGASSLASLSLAIGERRFSPKFLLILGFALMSIGFLLLALWSRRLAIALAMVGIGAGIGTIVPCVSAWLAESVRAPFRGRALGLLNSAHYLSQFAAPFWSQSLFAAFGWRGLFLSAAIVAISCAILALIVLRSVMRHQIQPSLHELPAAASVSSKRRSGS